MKNLLTMTKPKALHLIFHIIENDNEKLVYADVKKPNLEEIFESLTKEGENSAVKKW